MAPDHIYFLYDRTNQAIKIGVSSDPEKRVEAIRSSSPQDLTPIRYVRIKDGLNGFLVEQSLHERFSHLRIRGEWFRAEPELFEFAKSGELPDLVMPIPPPPSPVLIPQGQKCSIQGLSEYTGVPPRTLRYYISTGLLHSPWTKGKAASYDQTHVDRVKFIQEQHNLGLSLDQIARDPVIPQVRSQSEEMIRYQICRGIYLDAPKHMSPWDRHRFERALAEMERVLSGPPDREGSGK